MIILWSFIGFLPICTRALRPDTAMFGPDSLGINEGYWTNVMESIYHEGYVTGISVVSRLGAAPGIKLVNLKITQKGIEYLQENSAMQKAADFLRTVKEIVPGF